MLLSLGIAPGVTGKPPGAMELATELGGAEMYFKALIRCENDGMSVP